MNTTCEEKLPLDIENPKSVQMNDVEFIIITERNSKEALSKLNDAGLEPVIFGLSGTDYKSLSTNMQEIIKHILTQRKIIKKYKDYYELKP